MNRNKSLLLAAFLVVLLVVSISAVSVESKVYKKISGEKSSVSKKTAEKKVVAKTIGTGKKTPASTPSETAQNKKETIKENSAVPAPELPENSVAQPLETKNYLKLNFPNAPQRGKQLRGNYLTSAEPYKILLKSRQFIPDKKIYSDARAVLNQKFAENKKAY